MRHSFVNSFGKESEVFELRCRVNNMHQLHGSSPKSSTFAFPLYSMGTRNRFANCNVRERDSCCRKRVNSLALREGTVRSRSTDEWKGFYWANDRNEASCPSNSHPE